MTWSVWHGLLALSALPNDGAECTHGPPRLYGTDSATRQSASAVVRSGTLHSIVRTRAPPPHTVDCSAAASQSAAQLSSMRQSAVPVLPPAHPHRSTIQLRSAGHAPSTAPRLPLQREAHNRSFPIQYVRCVCATRGVDREGIRGRGGEQRRPHSIGTPIRRRARPRRHPPVISLWSCKRPA